MVMSKGIRGRGRTPRRGDVGPRAAERPGSPLIDHPSTLIRLAGYLLPLWPKLTAGILCLVFVSLLALYNGILARCLLNAIKDGSEDQLDRYALLAVAAFVGKGVFAFGQIYLMSNVAQRLAMRIRNQVFEHLQSLSLSFFETRKTGQLMAVITTDVPVIQNSTQ